MDRVMRRTIFWVLLHVAFFSMDAYAFADSLRIRDGKFFRGENIFIPKGFIIETLVDTETDLKDCFPVPYCERHLEARDFLFGRGKFLNNSAFDLAKEYDANTIRFNLNQSALDPSGKNYSKAYLEEVKLAVRRAREEGFVVILALFDARNTNAPAGLLSVNPSTPLSNETTLRAALLLGEIYGRDHDVMIELLNEPWPPTRRHIGWKIWRDGGAPKAGRFAGVPFIGVNEIIRELRKRDSDNIIILQGLMMSMKGFPGGVSDELGQVAYSVHPFFGDGQKDRMDWKGNFGDFANENPFIITAWDTLPKQKWCHVWGLEKPMEFLRYIKKKNIGVIAYALDIPFTIFRDFREIPPIPTKYRKTCEQKNGYGELILNYFKNPNAAQFN